jgi:hypothetical protein
VLLRSLSSDFNFISAALCASKLSAASYTHTCYTACYLHLTVLTFDMHFYLLYYPKTFLSLVHCVCILSEYCGAAWYHR